MENKLLIVDDEAGIREILQFNLENAGYAVDTAASAEEALEKLGAQHSLILLDVMMGGMSGLQMAKLLRDRQNQVPIIFLTAKTDPDDLLAGFYCDVDGSTEIILDRNELKEAVWVERKDVEGQPHDLSLTNEMMVVFREGREPLGYRYAMRE